VTSENTSHNTECYDDDGVLTTYRRLIRLPFVVRSPTGGLAMLKLWDSAGGDPENPPGASSSSDAPTDVRSSELDRELIIEAFGRLGKEDGRLLSDLTSGSDSLYLPSVPS
jgi:hypothetical protein